MDADLRDPAVPAGGSSELPVPPVEQKSSAGKPGYRSSRLRRRARANLTPSSEKHYGSLFAAIRAVVPLHSPAILEFVLSPVIGSASAEFKRGSTRLQNSGMKIRFFDLSETALKYCMSGRTGVVGITCKSSEGNKRYMFSVAEDGSLKETSNES